LNATTGHLEQSIRVGAPVNALAIDGRAARIYIGAMDSHSDYANEIVVLDASTGRIRSLLHNMYPAPPTSTNTYGGPIVPDTRTGFLIVNERDDVRIVDMATGHRLTVTLDEGSVNDVTVDERTGHILASNTLLNDPTSTIQVIDEATGRLLNHPPTNGGSSYDAYDGGDHLTVDERAGRAFASLRYPHYGGSFNYLNVVSTRDGHSVSNVNLNQDGAAAVEIAVDERNGHTYVAFADAPAATYGATQIDVFDAVSGRIINHLTVGHGPPALAVDAQDQRLFVANGDDNTVTMLDTTHL